MKKGIKVVLIVFGVLIGLFVLLGVIGALLPEDEESGNATAESNKSSTSETPVKEEKVKKEKPATAASGSSVKAGKPAPAEDFKVRLTDTNDGAAITGYTGNAKNLTIPATIEGLPVVSVDIKNIVSEQIFVPEGVISVSFPDAKNLRAISLPSTLKNISFDGGITMLTSISLPNGVTYIKGLTGSGLRSIVIPASVKLMDTIYFFSSYGTFEHCNDLITAEIYGDNLRWDYAFRNCESLQTAIIHEGVTRIGYATFENCKALKKLTLPSSLEAIEGNAFEGCSSLTSVVIPSGVTNIGDRAFRDCTNISSVTIPKSVTNIGGNAFANCKNLVTVDIEEGALIDHGFDVFTGCDKLNLKSQAAIRAAFSW